MATPKVQNRYPRRAERIAPVTLRDFLTEPLPPRLWRSRDDERLRLCDLDETAWERFSDEEIAELSGLVVARIAACHARKVFQERHFPRPTEGLRLDDLRLENRTRRCLARVGFDDDLRRLGEYSISDLLRIRAFGPRCLVDFLCALESPRASGAAGERGEAGLCEELTAAARRLAKLSKARLATCDDPRFAQRIRAVDVDADTAEQLARRLLRRERDPADAQYAAEQVRQLVSRIEGLSDLTLEEELIQIFACTPYERNRKILIGYYGWDDGLPHTLTEIGDRFGITRERIRQVCAKLTKKHHNAAAMLAPVMDSSLALIERRLPCSAEKLEAELANKGWTRVGMSLDAVANGARLLGRAVRFKVVKLEKGSSRKARRDGGRLAVRPDQDAATLAIVDVARKEIYFRGAATVAKLERTVSKKYPHRIEPKLVPEVIRQIRGFSWLDESSGWFRLLPIAKHGLPKAIDKILAVAGQLTAARMAKAMSRNHRLWREPLPDRVLLEYCRQTPGIRVDGKWIIADPPRDWTKALTGVELELVRVLKEHGPVMERGAMEDICVAGGMNRFSFHAFISWSPVIAQFGHSVYGLLGAEVEREKIEALMARRRAERLEHRVLDDHGRTDDGRIWLSYRLSKAASTYAVITIPAALKKVVRGRFRILDTEGRQIGTLATKDGRAWGLGALMRRQNAHIGDRVVVTLDLNRRTAELMLNSEVDE